MSEEKKVHWKSLENPDYIGAYFLMDGAPPPYKELTVTITGWKQEDVHSGVSDKTKKKLILMLQGLKPMVMNATNLKRLTKLFASPYPADWVGKSFIIYVEAVKAFGETLDSLRVRTYLPKVAEPKAKEELTPEHPNWEKAKEAIKSGATTIEKVTKAYIVSEININLLKQ